MDWNLAIDRHREALLRMLAALFVMAGGGVVAVMPRHVRTEIWWVLRPAESATRRLIVVVLEHLQLHSAAKRVARGLPERVGGKKGGKVPSFALFDPRKRFYINNIRPARRGNPRLWSPGMDYPVFVTKTAPEPDDAVSAARLFRRMQALQAALADLPKQARRLARWQAKREQTRAKSGKYIAPMRPGKPPGHRARQRHLVDFTLSHCHELALYALNPPDT